ncbi:GNAT family N-acetyltransferase [Glycomyces paridis]|uniref:GNAT family N-acetyltransferase n=1 Tax=Glycomyces paridis TaxID=2126555 RepID=A0A4V6T6C1_9ACTN|nr:GNAT family N-acetyltransferase [Glycomyces paridis]THV28006.1 GNAT family N-acetyltransferase [Glycomyces paridis]
MTEPYALFDRLPTPEEHRRLAEAVGWGEAFDWDTTPASLDGSLAGVVAFAGDEIVGMGRLVGDGAKYFYVQDVAVLPDRQGAGIGAAVVRRLLDHIARTVPSTAFVGLFATDGAVPLYERHGFGHGDMAGMFRLVEPNEP